MSDTAPAPGVTDFEPTDLTPRSVTLAPRALHDRPHHIRTAGEHRITPPFSFGNAFAITPPSGFRPIGADTLAIYAVPGDATGSNYATFTGGPIIDNADIQLLFWGTEWHNLNAPSANQIANGMNAMLATTYFDRMGQYGFQWFHMKTPLIVEGTPPNNFQFSDIGDLVWQLIDQGTFPEPDEVGGKILYLVVMPQSVNTGIANARGSHGAPGDYDFPGGWTYAWAAWSGYGTVDFVTDVLSHEIVEAASDPEPGQQTAWVMNTTINAGNEIGDACNNTVDRLDGVLVQAYFSQIDHACVIPFPAAPTISLLTPSSGPPGGGTSVRIDGTGFDTGGNTTVTFGGVQVPLSCPSSTQCFATSPPGNGVVDVIVTRNRFSTAPATNAKFYYSPSVTSIEPTAGKVGDVVTIHGIGFSWAPGSTSIRFGGSQVPAQSFSCYPGPDCTAIVPPGAGTVDVVVTVNGTSTTPWSRDHFSYLPTAITSFDVNSGSIAGGTYVNLFGNGFDPTVGGTRVFFGNVETTYVNCMSSTWCYVRSPASVTGYGPVHISFTAFGVWSPPSSDAFNYVPATLTSITNVNGTGAVMLNGYAPAGGVSVSFTSSDPSAVATPAPLSIAAGNSSATFPITLLPIAYAETLTLRATDGTTTVSMPISVIAWPALSLQIGAATLAAGASSTMTVSLASPAPAGGATVSLASSAPTAIAVPSSVTVPAGAHQAVVSITNAYNGTPMTVTLTASYAGSSATNSVDVPSSVACRPRTCSKGFYWNPDDCACERGLPQ